MAGPSHLSVVLLLILPATIAAEARAIAPQQTGDSRAEVQVRLKRVSSDLFTRTDRATESIRAPGSKGWHLDCAFDVRNDFPS